jgi:hypothetical protein
MSQPIPAGRSCRYCDRPAVRFLLCAGTLRVPVCDSCGRYIIEELSLVQQHYLVCQTVTEGAATP